MKRIIFGMLGLLLLAPTISRAAYSGENLFTNPSFEDHTTTSTLPDKVLLTTIAGRPDTTYGSPTSGVAGTSSQDSAEFHSGSKSLKIYMPIETTTGWRAQVGFYADNNGTQLMNPDETSRTLRMHFWAKSDGGPIVQGVDCAIFVNNTGTPYSAINENLVNYVGQYGNAIDTINSATWTQYWLEVSLPDGTGIVPILPMIMCNNSGSFTRETPLTVWIDDLDIYDPLLRGVPVELSNFELN
jgi:hypothetical protein